MHLKTIHESNVECLEHLRRILTSNKTKKSEISVISSCISGGHELKVSVVYDDDPSDDETDARGKISLNGLISHVASMDPNHIVWEAHATRTIIGSSGKGITTTVPRRNSGWQVAEDLNGLTVKAIIRGLPPTVGKLIHNARIALFLDEEELTALNKLSTPDGDECTFDTDLKFIYPRINVWGFSALACLSMIDFENMICDCYTNLATFVAPIFVDQPMEYHFADSVLRVPLIKKAYSLEEDATPYYHSCHATVASEIRTRAFGDGIGYWPGEAQDWECRRIREPEAIAVNYDLDEGAVPEYPSCHATVVSEIGNGMGYLTGDAQDWECNRDRVLPSVIKISTLIRDAVNEYLDSVTLSDALGRKRGWAHHAEKTFQSVISKHFISDCGITFFQFSMLCHEFCDNEAITRLRLGRGLMRSMGAIDLSE